MKKFFSEFKKFISRGNIVDLSVAVIIGSAFSAIVTAFTDKIIMPIINFFLSFGAEDGLESAYTFLKKVTTDGVIDLEKSIYIDWGAFITAILNFLLIALTLFLIVKVINSSRKYINEVGSLSKKENRKIYKELKEKAKAENKKFKLVLAEYKAEQEAIKKAEAEAKAKSEKLAHPGEEALLIEIRDLLKQNQQLNLENAKLNNLVGNKEEQKNADLATTQTTIKKTRAKSSK